MPHCVVVTFNHIVLLTAIAIGLAAGIAGLAAKPTQSALGRAFAVGLVTSGLASIALVYFAGRDVFALFHLVYLIATAAVPIAAVLVLTRPGEMSTWTKRGLLATTLALPIGLYASHVEPFWLRVDEVNLIVPPAEAGLRIGVLSDLQTTNIGDYENDAIDTLIAQEPDFVVIPGDIWQLERDVGYEERAPEFEALLARLDAAVPHVFMVNGDTDTVPNLRRLTQGTSIVVLDNEVVEIEVRGIPVRIGGISHNGDDFKRPATFEQLMAGGDNTFRLLLAHRPGIVNILPPESPIDLVVAGHTHGGQIAVPFFDPLVTLSEVPRSVAGGGLSLYNNYAIYVSTGVGRERHRAPQVRFGVRPSIGIITTK